MVISTLARSRRKELRDLRTTLIATEAGFRLVRREIDRLVNRKAAIPEQKDLQGLINKMLSADKQFDAATAIVQRMASGW